MAVEKETKEKNHSIFTLISYSVMSFGSGTAFSFIVAYGLYFYEVEVGLPIILYTLAYTIFSIWDAVNDPIVGYLSDKPHFYTKRWGRRFPWIIFGFIPVMIFFLLIFSPPNVNPIENAIVIFTWLVLFLCAYEWFYTAATVNYRALFPQKFRSNRDRRYITGFIVVGFGATQFFGIIVPPLIIVFGDKSSFFTAALLIVIITAPFIIIGIPGCREDSQMIEDFLKSEEKAKEKANFFHTMKVLFKNRNFIAMLAIWMCISIYNDLAIGSVIYYVRYVLQIEEFWSSLILLGLLIMELITIPFWIWIIGKIGEIKTIYIGVLGMAISMLPILLFRNLFATILAGILIGFAVSASQCADEPLFASVIDQVVVQEHRRTEGVYHGVLELVLRAAAPLFTVIIAFTHILTAFDPNANVQTPLAQWGIIVDVALVPIILALIGVFLFWRLWQLPEQERTGLRTKLREIKL